MRPFSFLKVMLKKLLKDVV